MMGSFAMENVKAAADDKRGAEPRPQVGHSAKMSQPNKRRPDERRVGEGGHHRGGRTPEGLDQAEMADAARGTRSR